MQSPVVFTNLAWVHCPSCLRCCNMMGFFSGCIHSLLLSSLKSIKMLIYFSYSVEVKSLRYSYLFVELGVFGVKGWRVSKCSPLQVIWFIF